MKSVLTHQQEKTEKYKNVLKNNKDIHIIQKRKAMVTIFMNFHASSALKS